MIKVTVVRKDWLRGETYNSMLLRGSDNKMCCLGFCALTLGYTEDDIRGRARPDKMGDKSKWHNIKYTENFLIEALMRINDDIMISDKERESDLKKIGLDAGIEFEFVD